MPYASKVRGRRSVPLAGSFPAEPRPVLPPPPPHSSQVVTTDTILIPTGDFTNVTGTAYDFQIPRTIGHAWADTLGFPGLGKLGYDTCWVNDAWAPATDAKLEVWSPSSGIKLSVTSDQPAIQGAFPPALARALWPCSASAPRLTRRPLVSAPVGQSTPAAARTVRRRARRPRAAASSARTRAWSSRWRASSTPSTTPSASSPARSLLPRRKTADAVLFFRRWGYDQWFSPERPYSFQASYAFSLV